MKIHNSKESSTLFQDVYSNDAWFKQLETMPENIYKLTSYHDTQ